ncbi:hypothetical protein K470DRAFT_216637 [Piedraia hortae CBS 480.64]|uniref:Ras guanyl-nucleotide exchange factor RasGEF n=1 Tax=Piedraia hortae CBS 480.64 TaxID=1314780 RepID=A0A6A7C1T5_9PEZI|nr:hypothetical protein K470DRAFT_216637 [Piedraia hortae CBS 480.64]
MEARSLYRQFLREMPARKPSLLANPSSLQQRLRAEFTSRTPSDQSSSSSSELAKTRQFLQYLRAQRQYITLLERYNPGMNMDEEDRVRMTARRVGLDVPD